MEINKPFYVVDEDYLTLKDNAFTIVKGKDNIYIRNITGIQISFEHSFLPPEKEKPKSRTSSLIINGLLFYFVMLYIVLALFISFIFFKSLFVFLAMMLILPIIKFFYFEFEKFSDKRYEKQKVYLHGKYMLELEEYNRKVADWKRFPYRMKLWEGNMSEKELLSTNLEFLLELQKDIIQAKQEKDNKNE